MRHAAAAVFAVAVFSLIGCASRRTPSSATGAASLPSVTPSEAPRPVPPPEPLPVPMQAPREMFYVDELPCRKPIANTVPVKVYYGTSRARTSDRHAEKFYGWNRTENFDIGIAIVSIPPNHECGKVESPGIFEFVRDERRHMVLKEVRPLDRLTFVRSIRESASRAERPELFVFIHGFNTTFEEAALRTAQLFYDTGYQGAPVFYSWPAKGNDVGNYRNDKDQAEWAAPHLRKFLDFLAAKSGAERIHVIVHSMGNYVFAKSMQDEKERPKPYTWQQTKLSQVTLAAADLDAENMKRLAETLKTAPGGRVTLYTSKKDTALFASIGANFGRVPVGLANPLTMFVAKGIDTIDASALDCDWMGHAYFASNALSLFDLRSVILNGLPPLQRGLRRVGDHWVFDCASPCQ